MVATFAHGQKKSLARCQWPTLLDFAKGPDLEIANAQVR
jgi:hypothetical protein